MPRIKQLADKYAMVDWGSHLIGRIKLSGATQQQIGDAMGITQQAVSKLLKRPEELTVRELRGMCKVVSIDPAALIKAVGIKKEEL